MDGMKPGKVGIGPASCVIGYSGVVPPEHRDGLREITQIWVQPGQQRQGHGTNLMLALCEQADDERIVLLVHAEPYRTEMSRDDLRAWYERFGFKELPDSPYILARPWTKPH